MSLILDALNRSRADANPVPGLTTHHPVEQVAVNRRQYLLWVALSVAVVVIAWLFMERYSAPHPARNTDIRVAESPVIIDGGADSVSKPMVALEPAASTVIESALSEVDIVSSEAVNQPSASTAGAEALLLDEEMAAAENEPPNDNNVVVSPDAVPVSPPVDSDAVAQLYQTPRVTEEPARQKSQRQSAAPASVSAQRDEAPIDVAKMLQLARDEAKNVGLAEHPVPLLIDLSQQIKDSVPTIYYLRHDYSSDTSRSTVVLNSKTLSVGGIPAAGMKVEEILPDSVVLNYQGTQFRLSALNSWINL